MTDSPPILTECSATRAILQTLAYFEVFSYPLTREEVWMFAQNPDLQAQELFSVLETLVKQSKIFQFGPFFQTQNQENWVQQRLDCNRRADEILPIAKLKARFIGQFPFVRGVFISGSLSKHYMRPDSDVDFFIVTEPGRLWLARTLLVLYKKIFLLNSHKYFCVNYFVDTQHLEIAEKNLFTATETITLLPMWGREWYEAFCRANPWAWQQFPHFARRSTQNTPLHSSGFFKKILEKLLSGALGNWLDQKALQLTVKFWKKKFSHMDSATFDLALKSRRGISKHHPLHFQQKVLKQYEENLSIFFPPETESYC